MRIVIAGLVFVAATAAAQSAPEEATLQEMRAGKGFIATPVFTAEQDAELL